jgi:amidase
MTGLDWESAYQVAAAIRGRDVSVADVLEDQLDRIQRHDARLRSVVTLDAAGSRRGAAEADQALARGQVWDPLHGVGVTVEDHHATAGMRSTFGGYPRLLNIEHHQILAGIILAGIDASMAPGFETAESAAATKQSADYWARG